MKKFSLFVVCLILVVPKMEGQERCGTMPMDSLRRIEQGTESLQDFENWLQKLISKNPPNLYFNGRRAVVTIPVVVHVIHNGDPVGSGENISQAQIYSQLEVLNEDFRRMMGTPGYNTHPAGADVEIEWCPAVVDPNGNIMPEPGIDRVNLGVTSYSSSSTINSNVKPQTYWDPNRYCNIWTVNFSGSLLGYAQFPNVNLQGIGTNNGGATTDGVVVRHTAFGRVGNVQSPYNGGRTLTHELGHWLGLRHIWGDGSSCSATDYCDDTPKASAANYGCPVKNSCNDGTPDPNDMVENYMDYTNDACMNIFTQCQKTRMLTALYNAPRRASLLNSNVCTLPVTFSYTGKVVNAANNQGIPQARVYLDGKVDYHTVTDSNGFFTISNLQADVYDIYAGKWGFVTNVLNSQNLQQSSPQVILALVPGYYDDFLLDFGWTESGNATTGKWVRGTPIGTTYTSNNVTFQSNPGTDVAGDFGTLAYVTGNAGGGAGTDDVDNGTTILTSPVFDLSTYTEPILSYYCWFFNSGGNNMPDDSLIISISNGLQTVVLEQVAHNSPSNSQWLFRTYRLKDFIAPSNNMRFIVRTFDTLAGHLVEAGLDLFRIKDSTTIANVPPKANFAASKNTVCTGDTVTFTDLTLYDPDSLVWTFTGANITVSSQKSPKVVYSSPGVYPVKLFAENEAGKDSLLIQDFITVKAVVGDFSADSQTICSGRQITYQSNVFCTAHSYQWRFEGGIPSVSNLPSPTVTYLVPGFYDVQLIVSNSYGSDTIVKNLYAQVMSPPQLSTTVVHAQNNLPGSITVNVSGGTGPFSFQWNDNAQQTAQTASGLLPGIYSVTVVDARGCSAVAVDTVKEEFMSKIVDVESSIELTFLPNPAKNDLQIISTVPVQKVEVMNAHGAVVKTMEYPSANRVLLDVSLLPEGFYVAKVYCNFKSILVRLAIAR
jgi:PKD repeat protein